MRRCARAHACQGLLGRGRDRSYHCPPARTPASTIYGVVQFGERLAGCPVLINGTFVYGFRNGQQVERLSTMHANFAAEVRCFFQSVWPYLVKTDRIEFLQGRYHY